MQGIKDINNELTEYAAQVSQMVYNHYYVPRINALVRELGYYQK